MFRRLAAAVVFAGSRSAFFVVRADFVTLAALSVRRITMPKPWKGRTGPLPQQQPAAAASATTAGKQAGLVDCPPSVSAVGDEVRIKVLAKPGARMNCVTGISAESVDIQVAAPPVDGEANAELVKYVAHVLKVRKSDVSLDKGSKSRTKTLAVRGGLSADAVVAALKLELSKE